MGLESPFFFLPERYKPMTKRHDLQVASCPEASRGLSSD